MLGAKASTATPLRVVCSGCKNACSAVQCSAERRRAAQSGAVQCGASCKGCSMRSVQSPNPVNPPRQSILPVRQSASPPAAPARPCQSNPSPASQSCPPVHACRVHLPARSTRTNQPRTTPPQKTISTMYKKGMGNIIGRTRREACIGLLPLPLPSPLRLDLIC